MGIIFDEVVGTVEPAPEVTSQTQAAPANAPTEPDPQSLSRLQRHLERRAARLHAD